MQGNISDVATLRNTVEAMDFLGAKPVHFILDRFTRELLQYKQEIESGRKVEGTRPPSRRHPP